MTKVGVLGTGPVGRAVSGRLAELGHDVVVGSRTATDDVSTFADAAAHGEVLVNATGGLVSIEALTMAGAENLAGKPLLDISNALDHSGGFPPRIEASQAQSNAERIQVAFPQARVVKALNTMNNALMVDPRRLPGPHTTFLAGDDEDAKAVARRLLHDMGWADEEVLDLGDLSGARALELYLVLWLRLAGALGGSAFNIHVVPGVSAPGGPWPAPEPVLPGPAAPQPWWGFGDVAIALLGAIVVGNLLAAVLVAQEGHTSAAVRAWTAVAVLTGPWVLLGGWPLYAARVKGNGPVHDLALRVSWRSAGIGVLGGALGLLTASVVAQLQVLITHTELDARAADVAHDIVAASPGALAVFAVATAFGAPVVEELAFRGLTYGSFLKRGFPAAWAVVWTTVLFAVFHFEPSRLLVLAALGGWIGVVRAVTGSTTASMVAHMTVNVPGALLILLAR